MNKQPATINASGHSFKTGDKLTISGVFMTKPSWWRRWFLREKPQSVPPRTYVVIDQAGPCVPNEPGPTHRAS